MCGESVRISWLKVSETGSPPHVWGKLNISKSESPTPRITPTCVGKALKDPNIGAIFKLQEHVF